VSCRNKVKSVPNIRFLCVFCWAALLCFAPFFVCVGRASGFVGLERKGKAKFLVVSRLLFFYVCPTTVCLFVCLDRDSSSYYDSPARQQVTNPEEIQSLVWFLGFV